jgi:hypothetical protein
MMNSQSFGTYPVTPIADEQPTPSSRSRRPRKGPFGQLWKAWLWLTGPRPERFGASIAGQERLRRSRLVSVLLMVLAVAILLLIPGTLAVPLLWEAVAIDAVFGLVAALLNRSGQGTLGGLVLIVLIDISTINFIITTAHSNPADPGLSNTGAAVFYLLVLPILNAGMVLPNRLIPVIGALQVGLIVLVFSQLPHSHLLQAEMQASYGGQAYNAILGPILLQVCGAAIVWLYSWSVDQAILRASQAEELAEARARLNEQARQIADQKQRLEEAILMVQAVQSRVANGDYSARVSLQGNDLLPLAVSFNILAERLGRTRNIEQDYHRLESAVQHVLEVCASLARSTAPVTMRATGTIIDRIYPFLMRLQQVGARLPQIGTMAEDLHSILQRQHELLSQLEQHLIGSLMLARDLAIETVQVPPGSSMERARGSLGMASGRISGSPGAQEQNDLRSSVSSRINSLLDQQIAFLEQGKAYCSQARDLGQRCMTGTRILGQRLKEAG